MTKKILIVVSIVVIAVSFTSGCKKKSSQSQTTEIKAEAEKQINQENMEDELNKLEKQIEQEASTEE